MSLSVQTCRMQVVVQKKSLGKMVLLKSVIPRKEKISLTLIHLFLIDHNSNANFFGSLLSSSPSSDGP